MTLDVSDVLLDPDFALVITIRRSTVDVDGHGRTVEATENLVVRGVVTPATEEQLQRLAEADRSNETIAIYTATRLTAGDDTHGPDVVTWRDGSYLVKGVWDYSIGGFVEALAVSDTMQGKAVA